jgi:Glycosyltransferases involved in cell wall biogenesis
MKYSIITVNFNNAEQLEQTIISVIDQNYKDYEYIIIDGGSTDNSVSIIQKYSSNINYWISEKDKGIYNGMNKGIAVAKGDYCLFLNSGDTFYNNDVLSKCANNLAGDFICGNANLLYPKGTAIWESPENIDETFFAQRLSLCHQSLFILTQLLKKRPYDESYRIAADFEQVLYESLVNKAVYSKIDTIICNYRLDGISSNNDISDKEKLAITEKYRDLNYLCKDELLQIIKN